MIKKLNDTIVALATPSGRGAISVIRISGKDAFCCLASCFRGFSTIKKTEGSTKKVTVKIAVPTIRKNKKLYGVICDKDVIIDEVVAFVFVAPHSYTGEHVVELSCHCNSYIIKQILRVLLKQSRLAEPGEFTQRAFINNKIDLIQAEAVADLLNVKTASSHQTAIQQLEGKLSNQINQLLEELTRHRVKLEVEIDFTDHDIMELDLDDLKKELNKYKEKLESLIKKGKEGRIIREGITVCLAGPPNVGKSSIFNALLESSRAIVTDQPGTTRDYLEETLAIEGYLVNLIDTAGLRESHNQPEAIGIDKSLELMIQAEKILYVEDYITRKGSNNNWLEERYSDKIIKILNKADILDEIIISSYESQGYIPVSAKTAQGLDKIKETVVDVFHLSKKDIDQGVLSNIRQIQAVENSVAAVSKAIVAIEMNLGIEFIAFDLKVASEYLEGIIGKVTDDDILNRIFADFCVGK